MSADFLGGAAAALLLAVLANFAYLGLNKRYPWFCTYLVALLCRTAISTPYHGRTGTILWGLCSLVVWPIELLCTFECSSHIYANYPKSDQLTRRIAQWSYGVSIGMSLAFSIWLWNQEPFNPSWMSTVVNIGWLVQLACGLILASQAIFCWTLARVPIAPNLKWHRRLLLVYFWFVVLSWHYAVRANPQGQPMTVVSYYWVGIVVLIGWLVLIRPAGEYTPISPVDATPDVAALDSQIKAEQDRVRKIRDDLFRG